MYLGVGFILSVLSLLAISDSSSSSCGVGSLGCHLFLLYVLYYSWLCRYYLMYLAVRVCISFGRTRADQLNARYVGVYNIVFFFPFKWLVSLFFAIS